MSNPTDTSRITTMLGHPQKLSADEVKKRRLLLDGLPVKREAAGAYRVIADLIGEDGFTLNVCELQVDELVGELNVISVACDPESEPDTDPTPAATEAAREARRTVWDCWERSELAAGTEAAFSAAASDGQSFIIADYDDAGMPTAFVHEAYDGATGIEVKDVADNGRLMLCIKHHVEQVAVDKDTGALMRVVDWFLRWVGVNREIPAVEFKERIWKTFYQRGPGDICYLRQFVTDPGKAERQVRVLDDKSVEDVELGTVETLEWGYPVIPLVAPRGGELKRMETPQRLTNAAGLDAAAAARTDGMRIGYTLDCHPLGAPDPEPESDSSGRYLRRTRNTGQKKALFQPGGWLQLQSIESQKQGSVGTLDAGDLEGQREHLKLQVELARLLGRSSVYSLPWNATGQPPSGVALALALRPFLKKVDRYAERWSVALRSLFELWQGMAGLVPLRVDPIWEKLDLLTVIERFQAAGVALELGVPQDQVATDLLRFDPDEAAAWSALTKTVSQARTDAVAAMTPPPQDGDGEE